VVKEKEGMITSHPLSQVYTRKNDKIKRKNRK